jgi:hypothetical protein
LRYVERNVDFWFTDGSRVELDVIVRIPSSNKFKTKVVTYEKASLLLAQR